MDKFWRIIAVCWIAAGVTARGSGSDFQGSTHLVAYDQGEAPYSKQKPAGPVAALQARLDAGETLSWDSERGYLPALLRALEISPVSQVLVASKTSFQKDRISPETPRALYFNDSVYVGYIPGAPLLEVSSVSPGMGAVFYTLNQEKVDRPRFARNDQCLECHASSKSMGVPGHLIRSLMTDEAGAVDFSTGVAPVNHTTPFEERWGGWYVTGQHGDQIHRGNLFGAAAFARQAAEPNWAGNLTNLSGRFDVKRYLEPESDIVALMILEHETHGHNFIARLQYETESALRTYGHIRYLKTIAEAFLRYILFTDEATIWAPIQGDPRYAAWFESRGPRDSKGRSLRQLDLKHRMFRYPCSYLIYSDAFQALPDPMKAHLFERLREILLGKDPSPDFDSLTPETKRAIYEILSETIPGFETASAP